MNRNLRVILTRTFEKKRMNKIENVEIGDLTNPRFIKPKEVKFTQNGQNRRWEMVTFSDCVFCLIFNTETQSFVLVRIGCP